MDARSLATGALAGAAVASAAFLWSQRRTSHCTDYPPRGAQNKPGAPVASSGVLTRGNVAVITGAGTGIGRAVAKRCATLGMRIVLAGDILDDLTRVRNECIALGSSANDVVTKVCDVSSKTEVESLKDFAFSEFKAVHFLMNNAAIQTNGQCGPYEHLDRWEKILAVNLWGVVYGCHCFAPAMIAQKQPAVIVNTGSKQGITAPPGDTAYNVSKASVKVLTEGLQHTLRSTPGCMVNAFLLVPGWTITMIATKGNQRLQGAAWDPKSAQDESSYDGNADPDYARQKLEARGAWTADRVVDELFSAIQTGAPFYVICPDNETSVNLDKLRMQWSADDLIFRRLPLSRWSEQHKPEFADVQKRCPA